MNFLENLSKNRTALHSPSRIISLVPSQTELLHHLGLNEQVIGITKFCIHPHQWFKTKTRIGGTKTLNIEKIKALQPDLILANKEENVREQVEELANHFPVWVSDVNTFEDAFNMIKTVGELTAKQLEAQTLVADIQQAFAQISNIQFLISNTAYLIWKDPYMTVGGDTFINDILAKAGFQNVFATKQRYPIITVEDLQAANCEVLLLSSEPYPFKQKHIDELQSHLPNTKILLADGEIFSWYGSRLLKAPLYFQSLHERLRL